MELAVSEPPRAALAIVFTAGEITTYMYQKYTFWCAAQNRRGDPRHSATNLTFTWGNDSGRRQLVRRTNDVYTIVITVVFLRIVTDP
jgi:hypothetical protein